jgi:hypothetical protein
MEKPAPTPQPTSAYPPPPFGGRDAGDNDPNATKSGEGGCLTRTRTPKLLETSDLLSEINEYRGVAIEKVQFYVSALDDVDGK